MCQKKVKINVKYERGHSYIETYEKVDVHCPNCGKKEVWASEEGDYYVGEDYICISCHAKFNLPCLSSPKEGEYLNWQNEQIVKAIAESLKDLFHLNKRGESKI